MSRWQRLLRVLKLSVKHPVVFLSGVIALPIIHVLVRRQRLGAKRLGERFTPRNHTQPLVRDIEAAREMAATLFIGVRLWRLDHQSCIARSVLLWIHLSRMGYAPAMVLGAKTDNPNELHTWVEVDHQPIDDSADVNARYQRFDKPYLA